MVDWSEIEALQNELEQVQQENVSSRLSDRNCVELVLKLKALGLVELINTTNGKCYLTPQRLEKDILRPGFLKKEYIFSKLFSIKNYYKTNQKAL